MKIIATLIGLSALILAAAARGALGEDPEKCNDRYGEQTERRDDLYNSQNETREYHARDGRWTVVVFDRKRSAVEIVYAFNKGTFAKTGLSRDFKKAEELLLLNGADWTRQKAKLGAIMENDRPEVWTAPDGRRAELRINDDGSAGLRISSASRIAEMAEWSKRAGIK